MESVFFYGQSYNKIVKDFTVTRVGYTRYCFIHNSELGHHLGEWQSSIG